MLRRLGLIAALVGVVGLYQGGCTYEDPLEPRTCKKSSECGGDYVCVAGYCQYIVPRLTPDESETDAGSADGGTLSPNDAGTSDAGDTSDATQVRSGTADVAVD